MPLSNVAHNPQAVWEALQAGNQRVIDGTIMDLNKIYEREGLTKGQDPRVVVQVVERIIQGSQQGGIQNVAGGAGENAQASRVDLR